MNRHFASLLAAALAGAAAPALAQHDQRASAPPLETWQGEWVGDWEDEATYRGVWHGTYTGLDGRPVEAEFSGTFVGESRFVSDEGHALRRDGLRHWREERSPLPGAWRRPLPPQPAPRGRPRFGYSRGERAAWLDECRARVGDGYGTYRDERGERRGRAIGGLLGAIGGGLAGNRIAERGDRVLGTVIGAGAGTVAGAAVGGAIGADGDRRRTDGRPDQCEAYLNRYEAGAPSYGGAGVGYPGYAYGPVMMVRVPIFRERSRECGCTTEVIEEIVEEAPAARPARRAAPRVAPTKRVRSAK